MRTDRPDAVLHAVRADALTAAEAVAWFAPDCPPGSEVIGYVLAAGFASWVRLRADGTVEAASLGGDVLAEAYELVLFDGHRELRWLRSLEGRGPAVALGEVPTGLPPGEDVTPDPPLRRGDVQARLLAGVPRPHQRPGWTTLASERYAAAHLPYPFRDGDVLQLEVVEYLTEDVHGNVDVGETRLLRLCATSRAAVQRQPAPITSRLEGTPA